MSLDGGIPILFQSVIYWAEDLATPVMRRSATLEEPQKDHWRLVHNARVAIENGYLDTLRELQD